MNRSAHELLTGTARLTLAAAGGSLDRNPGEEERSLGQGQLDGDRRRRGAEEQRSNCRDTP